MAGGAAVPAVYRRQPRPLLHISVANETITNRLINVVADVIGESLLEVLDLGLRFLRERLLAAGASRVCPVIFVDDTKSSATNGSAAELQLL